MLGHSHKDGVGIITTASSLILSKAKAAVRIKATEKTCVTSYHKIPPGVSGSEASQKWLFVAEATEQESGRKTGMP